MNKSFGIGCLVILVIAALLGMSACTNYNSLVALDGKVDMQWAQVEQQYQRRLDLIPNLVSTVEGQANFEKGTLTDIAEARASIGRVQLNAAQVPDEKTMQQWEAAQVRMGGALGRLMAVSESYPDLKANQAFQGLQAELAGTENRISVERSRFNEAAMEYNTAMKSFPTVVYAALMGFSPKAYFKSSPEAAEPPKVQFNLGRPAPAALAAAPAPATPPAGAAVPITTPEGQLVTR
jgi:LemA protein